MYNVQLLSLRIIIYPVLRISTSRSRRVSESCNWVIFFFFFVYLNFYRRRIFFFPSVQFSCRDHATSRRCTRSAVVIRTGFFVIVTRQLLSLCGTTGNTTRTHRCIMYIPKMLAPRRTTAMRRVRAKNIPRWWITIYIHVVPYTDVIKFWVSSTFCDEPELLRTRIFASNNYSTARKCFLKRIRIYARNNRKCLFSCSTTPYGRPSRGSLTVLCCTTALLITLLSHGTVYDVTMGTWKSEKGYRVVIRAPTIWGSPSRATENCSNFFPHPLREPLCANPSFPENERQWKQ